MRILVTGLGHGGTSPTREVVRGLDIVKWYPGRGEEDRNFFNYERLPENYGTKLSIENDGFTAENIIRVMKAHDDLYIVFVLRNPIDVCLSKIVRSQKSSDGGDGENLSDEATVEAAVAAVKRCPSIYNKIKSLFSARIHTVRFEDLILYPSATVVDIAHFLRVEEFPPQKAFDFYKHNTNKYQKVRYGNKLDESQVDIHKRWDTAYNGFFKDKKEDVERIMEVFK